MVENQNLAAKTARTGRGPARIGVGALGVVLVAAAAVGLAYGLRRSVVAALSHQWLAARGLDAAISIQRLDTHGFRGKVRLGPAADPDLSVEDLTVDYTLASPWDPKPLSLTVQRVRLVHPMIRARIDKRGLSLGGLDRLVLSARGRPGGQAVPTPRIDMVGGEIRLATPAGAFQIHADGGLDPGKGAQLTATIAPTALSGSGWSGQVGASRLSATLVGDQLDASLSAPVRQVAGPGLRLVQGRLDIHFKGLAPGFPSGRAVAGGLSGRLGADEAVVGPAANALRVSGLDAAFNGPSLRIAAADGAVRWSGAGQVSGGLQTLDSAQGAARALAFSLDLDQLDGCACAGRVDGAARWRAQIQAAGGQALSGGATLALNPARLSASGDLALDHDGLAGQAQAAVIGGIALPRPMARRLVDGALGGLDTAADRAALARDLTAVQISAPAVKLAFARGQVRLAAAAPILATAPSGARLSLATPGAQWRDGVLTGDLDARLGGGAWPALDLQMRAWRISDSQANGRLALSAQASLGPARKASLRSAGRIAYAARRLTYAAEGCSNLAADQLALGDNPIDTLVARLCPDAAAPLIEAGDSGWRLQGRLEGAGGRSPSLKLTARNATGALTADGGPGRAIHAALRLDRAETHDDETPTRLRDMVLSGSAQLAGDQAHGRLSIQTAKGQSVGVAEFSHDLARGEGAATLDAPAIRFARGGLQPTDLSPLAQPIRSAEGEVRFNGRLAWNRKGLTSSGEVATKGLDVTSPAGAVTRLAGDIHLVSLAPLVAAPNQLITAEKVDGPVLLETLRMVFDLDAKALSIQSADLRAAGGEIRLEPVSVPLDGGRAAGALVFSKVDLGKLLASSSLGDKIQLDAVVDGRLPFEFGPDGFKLLKGRLTAIRPGRLAIQRAVLVGDTQPNAIQDFAYQALANLAFTDLDAEVESRPGGRLGVVFHIKGRHDPPTAQEAYVPLRGLADGSAFQKSIPLPKGVPIDLTLDTSLNFDQVLDDYQKTLALGRQGLAPSRSGPVQPGTGKPAPDVAVRQNP